MFLCEKVLIALNTVVLNYDNDIINEEHEDEADLIKDMIIIVSQES